MTALKTIDTDFAAAMMMRGARLEGWEKSVDGRKLYWQLTEIVPEWMDEYRRGTDGLARFMQNRRMLINICKTELPQK
jgi:hypothetical protein